MPSVLAYRLVISLAWKRAGLGRAGTCSSTLDEYAAQLLRHMRHTFTITHDLMVLIDECQAYVPNGGGVPLITSEAVLPLRIMVDNVELSFMSTVTTFGAAQDITLSELSIETFYPVDETTKATLARRPWHD